MHRSGSAFGKLASSGSFGLVVDPQSHRRAVVEILPAPDGTGGGYSTCIVAVRRAGQLVTARTTNASVEPGAKELVTFAERWIDVASVLGPDAWADATPVAYVADRWSAFVYVDHDCCSEPGRPDASLLQPVLGPPDTFGKVVQAASPIIRRAAGPRSTLDPRSLGGWS